MTVEEVLARVEGIRAVASDDEVAHGREDDLHRDVLQAIAMGACADPAGCAKAALTTGDIEFARYYA